MNRGSILIVSGLALTMVVLALLAGDDVAAWSQTTDVESPTVPASDSCLVEPRRLPIMVEPALGAVTPAPAQPTVFAIPDGEPVDAAIAEALEATVRESLACRNAGDFLRAYALFSDRFVAALLGPPDAIDPDLVARLSVPPTPVAEADRLSLGSVSDARRLTDGRVGAIAVTQNAEEVFADYLFFVESGDRWLIDERVFLSDKPRSTPVG